jgi:hypothetical protein
MPITKNSTLNEIVGVKALLGNPTILVIMGANNVTCRIVGLASASAEAEDLATALADAFDAYRKTYEVLVGMGAVINPSAKV